MARQKPRRATRAKAPAKRRSDRSRIETMPTFNERTMPQHGIVVVPDISGELYRIDVDRGTVRRLRWQD